MCKCKDKNGDAGQPWLEKEFTDKCPCYSNGGQICPGSNNLLFI
jgi:hypothetical protein